MSKSSVLYIDSLDFLSLCIAFISKPLFAKVYYKVNATFFPSSGFERLIAGFGFIKITYNNEVGSLILDGFPDQEQMARRTFDRYIEPSPLYQSLSSFFNLNEEGKKKLAVTFRRSSFGLHDHGPISLPLLKKRIPDRYKRIVFLSYDLRDWLLLKNLHMEERIQVWGLYAYFSALYSGISFIVLKSYLQLVKLFIGRTRKNKKFVEVNINQNKTYYKVGFMPHKGFRYGRFYKKTYIYEKDPESAFYACKILTFFHGPPDSVSQRFCRIFKIPFVNIHESYSIKNILLALLRLTKFVIPFLSLKNIFSISRLSIWILILRYYVILFFHCEVLKSHPKLQVLLIYYDALAPAEMIMACHINNIETFSTMERPFQYLFFSHLCFDYYFIPGNAMRDHLIQRDYLVKKYITVGMLKRFLIDGDLVKNKEYLHKYIQKKNRHKLVICLGLMPVDQIIIDIYGEDGSSEINNISFIKCCIHLARKLQDHYFVLVFKQIDRIENIIKKSGLDKELDLPNIEIIFDPHKYNSYDLVTLSDIVIGKQTSIMEECLSAGKPVFYYDNEDYISGTDFFVNDLGIVKKSPKQIETKLHKVFE